MQEILARFIQYVRSIQFGPKNLIEIIVMAFLIYHFLRWVRNTRMWFLLRGLLLLLVFVLLVNVFELNVLTFIAERTLSVLTIALLVIFAPELRQALEQIGQNKLVSRLFGSARLRSNAMHTKEVTGELVKAAFAMSRSRTGALIVIEREIRLDEYIKTGIPVDGVVSSALLINIFEKNTPLHDGAVIMRGGRVVAATCYLPLSGNMEINKSYGTRHRAAIGISEVSDAVTIVVSEESGRVGVTYNGKIFQMNEQKLRSFLTKIILNKETVTVKKKDVTAAESVSIESLIEQNSVKEEVDFKDSSSGNLKQMKTFQSTTFRQEVEEEERRIYGTQNSKPKQQANAIQQVVNDIAAEARTTVPVPVNESETAGKIKIKTVQVPKEEIHEVKEETPASDDQPSEGGN